MFFSVPECSQRKFDLTFSAAWKRTFWMIGYCDPRIAFANTKCGYWSWLLANARVANNLFFAAFAQLIFTAVLWRQRTCSKRTYCASHAFNADFVLLNSFVLLAVKNRCLFAIAPFLFIIICVFLLWFVQITVIISGLFLGNDIHSFWLIFVNLFYLIILIFLLFIFILRLVWFMRLC